MFATQCGRAGSAAFKVFVAKVSGVGVFPNFLPADRVETVNRVRTVSMSDGIGFAIAHDNGGEAEAHVSFPRNRRSFSGKLFHPALFLRDAGTIGAAQLRPVSRAGD